MKNFIKSTNGIIISSLSVFFILILIVSVQCEGQSQKTLTQKEITAINQLYESHYIAVSEGGDGWEIDPDLWNGLDFQQRKNLTERLSIYYKNYTKAGKEMSGFCYFYDMATKKKIARWYENEYKEY